MPPHLHPRSAATSTLFAGTLLASFIVVGIPHIFPCPVPRRNYADTERQLIDEDGKPIANKQPDQRQLPTKSASASTTSDKKVKHLQDEAELSRQLQQEAEILEKQARECPVPKPKGFIGKILGFDNRQPESVAQQKRGDGKG